MEEGPNKRHLRESMHLKVWLLSEMTPALGLLSGCDYSIPVTSATFTLRVSVLQNCRYRYDETSI